MQSPSPAGNKTLVAEPFACTFMSASCTFMTYHHEQGKAVLEKTHVCVQADTGWWKPVTVNNPERTWHASNALVYKQAWNGRLAHRILKGMRSTGLQEGL